MAVKRELIQFTIVNSTDCDYNLPLFQQNVYSINATTKYSWDVTTEILSCGTGQIVINSETYSIEYATTLSGLLASLNGLGFGFFCSETSGGNTYIYVVDDTNIYGNLTLCDAGGTTTTTTTTTVAPTTTTTTTSTTTEGPTTTTTTSTTTEGPTTTTTTSTTTEAPTTTTTTTTTAAPPVTFDLASSLSDGPTACADYPTINTSTYYATAGSTLQNGTIIFVDFALTIPAPNAFYSNGVDYWNTGAGSGNLQNQTSCNPTTTTTSTTTAAPTTTTTTTSTTTEAPTTTTTTSTTTAGFEVFGLATSLVDGPTACADYPTVNTSNYYTIVGASLQNGTIIYVDSALTTPAPNAFYSNGVNYWNTGAGSGNLQNETSCNPTTTTTSTTTAAPTTTTTTTTTTEVGLPCDDYINNLGTTQNGINYIDCNGTVVTNASVDPNQSICVQQGSLNGGDSGNLTLLGSCGTYTTTTTTTE